ncbi:Leucine-, isoleucine-, valine-, threonine-, and alanine-binding protein precursor [compost metagenome]
MDLEGAYKKAGAALAVKEFFERDRVDFVPMLTRMMARGIDAIELDGNSPTTAGLIVKQARELGFEGRIVRTGGPATQEIVNVAGKQATEGMLVHTPIDPELPATQAYAARYAAKYKHPMNGFSPAFYDGTNMLFEAMRRAGTVDDTDRVRAEMEKLDGFDGSLGKLSWTGQAMYGINHQLNAPFYVAEVKDGREVIRARCTVEGCR